MHIKRKAVYIGAVLLLVGAIVFGLMPEAVIVDSGTVSRGRLLVTIKEEGKTRVVDRFAVSAPFSGFARRIDLDVGDRVEKGDLLVALEGARTRVLDTRSRAEAEARLAAARATLEAAKDRVKAIEADNEFFQSEYDRMEELYESKYISEIEFEGIRAKHMRSRAELKSALHGVEVAKFDVEGARAALDLEARGSGENYEVRAPVGGEVLKVMHKSEGAVVEGTPLIEIGDRGGLEVEVDLLSEDSVKVSAGTAVVFDRWGGGSALEGVVRVVEPVGFTKVSALGVEEQRVLVICDITSDRELWRKLGDGYRVEANFILWEGTEVLKVPEGAIFKGGDSTWHVFTIEGGKAVEKSIEIGRRGGLEAQVLEGLDEGSVVILHPPSSIEDGVSVRAR